VIYSYLLRLESDTDSPIYYIGHLRLSKLITTFNITIVKLLQVIKYIYIYIVIILEL